MLTVAVVCLVLFVLYAKRQSALVYRAMEEYEAAYDRMAIMIVRRPSFVVGAIFFVVPVIFSPACSVCYV